jgi:cell division protein FtsQ
MWSSPRLLNLAANALFALSALLLAAAGCYALVRSPAFPLRAIEVGGTLEQVRKAQIVGALQGHVSGTFFTVDLESVRSRFESISWVRRAEVRRRWPDRLVVRVEEHVALARWGRPEEARLVNVHGEAFSGVSERELPSLSGPGGSERLVATRYAEYRSLLAPLGIGLSQVLLSERLAWQLRLDNGLVLQLGRDAPRDPAGERLARFVQAYPVTVGRLEGRLERASLRVDLRYTNGFAVRVPGLERMREGREGRPRA